MKISLLTIVSVLLLLHEMKGDTSSVDRASQPCQDKSNISKYNEFVKKHILKERFNRNDKTQWRRYLMKKQLCGRVLVQSFIQADEGRVSQVCGALGQRVVNVGNLCISKSSMTVYDVRSREQNGKCSVTKVHKDNHRVVLGCNKVENICRPVHYEGWNNQEASNQSCS